MRVGLYAFQTAGRRNTEIIEGLRKILDGDSFDVILAPEYSNVSYEEGLALSQENPETLIIPGSTLVQKDTRDGKKIFNRANVFYGGERIEFYDKMFLCGVKGYSDFDHLHFKPAKKSVFATGTRPCAFAFDGKLIGLEICRDNDVRVSGRKTFALKPYEGKLDLQIVLSCGGVGRANAVKKNGYLLSVDGNVRPEINIFSGSQKLRARSYFIDADKKNHNDVLYITDIF